MIMREDKPIEKTINKETLIQKDVSFVTSQSLLKGKKELDIAHGNDIYRLRVTSTGKLILTK